MSMHRKPLSTIEREGLAAHGLDIGTPSQLSDAFRHGVAWAQLQAKSAPAEPVSREAVEVAGYLYKSHSGVYSQMPGDEWEPLMTVAQHQRIVAALAPPSPDAELVEAVKFAAKSLAQITSSDGSGHADIAVGVLRMAGFPAVEREALIDDWKSKAQWRVDAPLQAKP